LSHSKVVQAAIDAVIRASLEDPSGFNEAFASDKRRGDAATAAFRSTGSMFEAMGYCKALMDLRSRVGRIAVGYRDLGDEALAAAFLKLAEKISALVDAKIADGEQLATSARAASAQVAALTEEPKGPLN
jgi:hypothetical protein